MTVASWMEVIPAAVRTDPRSSRFFFDARDSTRCRRLPSLRDGLAEGIDAVDPGVEGAVDLHGVDDPQSPLPTQAGRDNSAVADQEHSSTVILNISAVWVTSIR